MMQELPSGLDGKSRSLLAENLKQLVVNESMSLRAMYQEAISVTPFRRVTLSMNDNVDRLRAFPSLTSDFSDKVLLLRLVSAPMPMPTKTLEDRKAFRETLQRELPAFMAELLAWDIPDEIRTGRNADRFGFDEWQHPSITASMFEQEPESVVLWVIDNSGLFVDGKPWGWAPSEALSDQLLDGPHGRKVVPLFKHSGACGRYLGLLKKRFPKRFECDHKNRGNFWMIHPQ